LVDLPGYGYAKVPIKVKKSWQHMMETYLSERSNLRSVIVILDIRRDPTEGDMQLLGWLKHYGIPAIPVLTKADKLSRQQTLTRSSLINNQIAERALIRPIVFSAKTRQGRDEIWEKIDDVIET
jgi:GTP-binding protein